MLVTFWAFALEAARQINALRVALARIRHPQTFVVVYTLMRIDVVHKTPVTLALEAAGRVHAVAVRAHRWHQFTFIDIYFLVHQI